MNKTKIVADRTELYGLLDRFLKERRLSEGGWASVLDEDKGLLTELLSEWIRLKFQRDPDGDLPVQFKLIDRNIYLSSVYRLVPYEHKNPSEALKAALANLRIALRELDFCDLQGIIKV